MRQATYDELAQSLAVPALSRPWFGPLQAQYGLSKAVLGCIFDQLVQQWARQGLKLRSRMPLLVTKYRQGASLTELCHKYSAPACLLLRRLIEALSPQTGSKAISSILCDPEQLPALVVDLDQQLLVRLRQDVQEALLCDSVYCPEADVARHCIGLEFEGRLNEALEQAGVAFWTEEELRAQGFVKTPDARLQVPVLMKQQLVFWVDSKATFGSSILHRELCQDQFHQYVNRYGPGLVIYWSGFVDEISALHTDVLLAEELHVNDLVMLPRLQPLQGA